MDMYEFDHEQEQDPDNEGWKEFLNQFMQPLTNIEEDDEKADPEYVVAEPVPIDKEELRPMRVSERELNQLIRELQEESGNFESEPSTSSKRGSSDSLWNRSKKSRISSPTIPKTHSPKNPPKPPVQDTLNTPTRFETNPVQLETPLKEPPVVNISTPLNPFYQQQLMTPQRVGLTTPLPSPGMFPSTFATPSASPMVVEAEATPNLQITGVYGSVNNTLQMPPILVINMQNQLEVQSPSSLWSQAFNSNGVIQLPQFQSVVVQVPTIDLLQNNWNASLLPQQANPPVTEPVAEVDSKNMTDDIKTKLSARNLKFKKFESLETEQPRVELQVDKEARGFTAEQKASYEQQMRIHAQLLAQHFLQMYANPKWWDKSEPVRENLKELKRVVKAEVSPVTANHIDECLALCDSWEAELHGNSERNKKYAEFLYEEQEYDQKAFEDKHPFRGRFHNRLMEHALSSKAILYPSLLPKVPFRYITHRLVQPPPSELRLFALGLERFHNEIFEKLNTCNPYKIREPQISCVVKSIAREYSSFRNEKNLMKLIDYYKKLPKMNPIKYYFTHKKAPAVKLDIEEVDLDNIVPPKNLRRGLLPKNWDTYMFSVKRVS